MISITNNNTKKYLACVAAVEKAKQSVREEQAFIKDYENAYKTFSKSHLRVTKDGRVVAKKDNPFELAWSHGDNGKNIGFKYRSIEGNCWFVREKKMPSYLSMSLKG